MMYNKNNPLRCFFAFEGYNSQGMGLNRLKESYPEFDWVCVGRSEIDKYAIQACEAVFPNEIGLNYGDISKIDWNEVPDFDLFTYSFPCQDISTAGNQRGLEEGSGTRSSLLWECQKAIEAKKPKYLLMENVKALVSKKFLPFLKKWEEYLSSMGYSNFTQVLNAKDYGIPQNRERVFMVSILGTDKMFHFPEPIELTTRLKDVLEQNVDEKYYLSQKMLEYFGRVNSDVSHGHNFTPKTGDDVAFAIRTAPGQRVDDNYVEEPMILQQYGDRGTKQYSVRDIAHTIPANPMSDRGQMHIEPKVMCEGNTHPSGHGMNGNVFNAGGIAPTLTTNKGEGPKIIQLANFMPDKNYENCQRGRLYSIEGLSPCIPSAAGEGGNITPKIVEPIVFDDYNQRVPKDQDVIGTITTEIGNPAPRHGYKIVEPINTNKEGPYNNARLNTLVKSGKIDPEELTYLDTYNQATSTEVTSTISARVDDGNHLVSEPTLKVPQPTQRRGVEFKGKVIHEGDGLYTGASANEKFSRGGLDGVSRTLKANIHDAGVCVNYRIRKLTPRECFRLMGVSDTDIDKIQAAGISNTQQYKMAGNSIVVDVLYHIFRKMFVDKKCESQQLSLF